MASEVNFILDQGATFTHTIIYKDSDGNPIDLTNYTARSKCRDPESGMLIWDLTSGNGITLGGPTGEITTTVAASVTATYEDNATFVHDLELVNGSVVIRLIQGVITVSGGV